MRIIRIVQGAGRVEGTGRGVQRRKECMKGGEGTTSTKFSLEDAEKRSEKP